MCGPARSLDAVLAHRRRSAGSARAGQARRGGCAGGACRRSRATIRCRRARRVRTTRTSRLGWWQAGRTSDRLNTAPSRRRSGREGRRRRRPTVPPPVPPATSDFGTYVGRTCGAGTASGRTTRCDRAASRTWPGTLPGRRRGSVAMARLAGDGSLVAEALAVVGLFVADVLRALLGVADVAQPAGAREIGPAGGLVEQAQGVQVRISDERRCSAGTASASRGSPSCASDAAIRPCTIGCALSIRTASAAIRSLKTSRRPARTPSTASRKTACRPGDDSLNARTTRATRSSSGRNPAAVVALAGRHVQHPKEHADPCGASVMHVRRLDSIPPPCGTINTCP